MFLLSLNLFIRAVLQIDNAILKIQNMEHAVKTDSLAPPRWIFAKRYNAARRNYLEVMHGVERREETRGKMTGRVCSEREELGVNEAAVYVTHVVASERVKYEGSVTYHPLPTYPSWRQASSAVNVSIVINARWHPPREYQKHFRAHLPST